MFLRQVSVPSEIVVICRGIIGSIFIFVFMKAQNKQLNAQSIRENRIWLLISGVCLGLNWVFLFAAYLHTTVAIASLCNYMAPMIVIVVAPVTLHERLNKRKIPCVIAAFVGIILVSGFWNGEIGDASGILMGLMAAICFVIIVICNRKMKGINPYDKSTAQLVISAVTVLPYVLVKNWGTGLYWDIKSVVIVIVLGLVHTGLAYCLYFSGMSTLPVQTVAILGYLEPVVSVICSAVILHEHMNISGWIGAILILGAAIISEKTGTKTYIKRDPSF
jgi:RarD protein